MGALTLLEKHAVSTSNIQNNSLQASIDSYLRYFAPGNSITARAKRSDLSHFVQFLRFSQRISAVHKLKIKDWTENSVQRFISRSLANGEAPATVARRLATLKHFAGILALRFANFNNPTLRAVVPNVKKQFPKKINKSELKKIRLLAGRRQKEKDSFNRLRNRTIFEFLLNTGLRTQEMRFLLLAQLDKKITCISNVAIKGRKHRNIFVNSRLRRMLKKYLKHRRQALKVFFPRLTRSIDSSLPLFISKYNASRSNFDSFMMGAKSIWRAINELSASTSLHPHLLRHLYAFDMVKHSKNLQGIADAMGHSDIRSTKLYLKKAKKRK